MKFFKNHWKIIIFIIFLTPFVLLVTIMALSQFVPDKPPPDFLITRNPVDLSQINIISQFRSCEGHKSMSQGVQGTKESPSSMAHYVFFDPKGGSALNTVKIFAPFDGYISHFLVEGLIDEEDSFALIPKSSKFPWWPFNQYRIHVSHAHTLPQYSGLAEMKAGDLIGYANIPGWYDGHSPLAFDFRMGVIAMPPEFKDNNGEPLKNMDSIFNYMTPEVFAEYKATIPGLGNSQDFIITAEWRAAHPCKYRDAGPYFDSNPEDYVTEKYRGMVYMGIPNDVDSIRKKLPCLMKESNYPPQECN